MVLWNMDVDKPEMMDYSGYVVGLKAMYDCDKGADNMDSAAYEFGYVWQTRGASENK